MACGGHCNVCPAHPGYDPPLSAVPWRSADCVHTPIDTNDIVEANYHFYWLAWYIDFELDRRNDSPPAGWFNPIGDASFDTTDVIYASDWAMLKTGIADAANGWTSTWCGSAYLKIGEPILDNSINEMRDKIDALRAECLCDCNYSCTCNCNYCTCNCNYACTCNCNY